MLSQRRDSFLVGHFALRELLLGVIPQVGEPVKRHLQRGFLVRLGMMEDAILECEGSVGKRGTRRIVRKGPTRPGIGAAPLFPSPGDPTKPMTRHLADKWLRKAEKLAGLEPQKGSLWHAYRRKWATERKHLSDTDVAAAGGWQNSLTLRKVYQQADAETMLHVVLGGNGLRERKA